MDSFFQFTTYPGRYFYVSFSLHFFLTWLWRGIQFINTSELLTLCFINMSIYLSIYRTKSALGEHFISPKANYGICLPIFNGSYFYEYIFIVSSHELYNVWFRCGGEEVSNACVGLITIRGALALKLRINNKLIFGDLSE